MSPSCACARRQIRQRPNWRTRCEVLAISLAGRTGHGCLILRAPFLAVFVLHGGLRLRVGVGILLLELLERRLLGLRPVSRLLLAALLLGIVLFRLWTSGTTRLLEGHTQLQQQREALLVRPRRGRDRNVEAPDLI